MAVTALYQGKTVERNTNGITTTETYSGSKTDCETWANGKTIGATYTGLGRLESISISQYSGSIYTVTAKYQIANGTSAGGSSVTPPDYAFGQYSASMDGSMISTPLEIHKNASGQYDYLSNWNHFLIAKYPVGGLYRLLRHGGVRSGRIRRRAKYPRFPPPIRLPINGAITGLSPWRTGMYG